MILPNQALEKDASKAAPLSFLLDKEGMYYDYC